MASLATCPSSVSLAAELHTDCWRSWDLESPEWLMTQDDENEASGLSGESSKEELVPPRPLPEVMLSFLPL